MAEPHSSSSRIRRNMSKLAFRSKEKVMRSFGMAEETKDEILEHYVMLANKQQLQMQKLQRDMRQYLQALKAMSLSQKAFYNSLYEVYDDDWSGKDVIASCSQRSELLYDDIFARFQAEVIELLHNHLLEYQGCKVRIEKRGRKLVDYDAAKRTLQSLESAKKPDGAKIDRAREGAQQARERYEELNSLLHEQLPTLHDSRLSICVSVFSSICESEKVFSNEVAELRTKLNNVLLNLKSAFDEGEYRIQRMQPPLDNDKVARIPDKTSPVVTGVSPEKKVEPNPASDYSNSQRVPPPRLPDSEVETSPSSDPSTHEYVNLQVGVIPDTVKPVSEDEENGPPETVQKFPKPSPGSPTMNGDSAAIQPIYEEPPLEDSPVKAAPPPTSPSKPEDVHKYLDLPPNYLFSVQALYQYRSSDDDELSFEKGDVIHIIQHPDPEEQDEGWQMGVRKKDWEEKKHLPSIMGVFPENFTKRI